MKSFQFLPLLAGLAHAAPAQTSIPSYELKLVLEGTGDNAAWRLHDEDVPAHARQVTDISSSSSELESITTRQNNGITCSTSHQAESQQCSILISSIQYSTAQIPTSPRNIVYGNCYISWSAVVDKEQSALWSGAYDVNYYCKNGGNENNFLVSGLARGYLQEGVTQCLSNRGNGCS